METNEQNEEIEIDLSELFRVLWSKLGYILLSALALGLLVVLVSKLLLTPKYESTTKMYVLSKQDANSNAVTSGDLQASTLLTKDYAELIKSRRVVEKIISDLDLDMNYKEFLDKLTVTTENDTRIITISVENEDPYLARQIADAIREAAAVQIQNVMNTESVNVVDEANIPDQPVSPNIPLYGIIGCLAGAFLSLLVIVVIYLTNDTIQTSDDVEKYLGVSTLGMIPLEEGKKKGKKRTRKKNRG